MNLLARHCSCVDCYTCCGQFFVVSDMTGNTPMFLELSASGSTYEPEGVMLVPNSL